MTVKVDEHQTSDDPRLRRRRRARLWATAGISLVLAALTVLAVRDRSSDSPSPPPPPPSWSGGFDTGDLRQYAAVQEAAPGRIATVASPRRQGRFAARLTANDDDLQGGENPRAQLLTETLHRPGDEQYIGWSTYFPADFPAIPGGFFVFFQFHGAPYNGSPPLGFGVESDGQLVLRRSSRYGYDRIWSAPLQTGRWIDFVAHVKWSRDEEDGFVELWLGGTRQTFSVNGQQRLYSQTVEDDQEGLQTIPTNYRRLGIVPGDVTIYHDEVKVGTSYASVAPSG